MAANEYGWFPRAKCIEFLGISDTYFRRIIAPRIPADCTARAGKGKNAPLWYCGKAVWEAASTGKQLAIVRTADRELFDGDPMLAGGDSPGLERLREASADIKELQRDSLRESLIPRDKVHDGFGRLATIIRGAGETLQRNYGREAQDILDEALADFDREAADTFGE